MLDIKEILSICLIIVSFLMLFPNKEFFLFSKPSLFLVHPATKKNSYKNNNEYIFKNAVICIIILIIIVILVNIIYFLIGIHRIEKENEKERAELIKEIDEKLKFKDAEEKTITYDIKYEIEKYFDFVENSFNEYVIKKNDIDQYTKGLVKKIYLAGKKEYNNADDYGEMFVIDFSTAREKKSDTRSKYDIAILKREVKEQIKSNKKVVYIEYKKDIFIMIIEGLIQYLIEKDENIAGNRLNFSYNNNSRKNLYYITCFFMHSFFVNILKFPGRINCFSVNDMEYILRDIIDDDRILVNVPENKKQIAKLIIDFLNVFFVQFAFLCYTDYFTLEKKMLEDKKSSFFDYRQNSYITIDNYYSSKLK